jgi:hypothetical protein
MAANGCTVQAQTSWTETDGLNANNAIPQLQWNDPFHGSYTYTASSPTVASGYCQPCYEAMQSVSNAQVTVTAAPGSCPADANINSGTPVTYPATNVTVTP